MNFRYLLIVMTVVFAAVNCQMEDSERSVQKRQRKFCGSLLVDTLNIICKGVHAGWNKRNNYHYDDDMLVDDLYNYDTEEDSRWPLLSHLGSSNAFLPRGDHQQFRYKRGGIIEECCEKSCTIRQLKQYCQ